MLIEGKDKLKSDEIFRFFFVSRQIIIYLRHNTSIITVVQCAPHTFEQLRYENRRKLAWAKREIR